MVNRKERGRKKGGGGGENDICALLAGKRVSPLSLSLSLTPRLPFRGHDARSYLLFFFSADTRHSKRGVTAVAHSAERMGFNKEFSPLI